MMIMMIAIVQMDKRDHFDGIDCTLCETKVLIYAFSFIRKILLAQYWNC